MVLSLPPTLIPSCTLPSRIFPRTVLPLEPGPTRTPKLNSVFTNSPSKAPLLEMSLPVITLSLDPPVSQ